MHNFHSLLEAATRAGASDIFIISGQPLSYKVSGSIVEIDDQKVLPNVSLSLIQEAYDAAGRDIGILLEYGDDDFAVSLKELARFRISTYKQRGSLAAVIRIIAFGIPDYRAFGIPDSVLDSTSKLTKGLVLITGPAGNGKSTTLATIIDRINRTRSGHIITLEEPIEYLYRNDKSIISQREISLDTRDYITALRSCLRQAPDVILLGEMRDYDTIRTAMTAAETGHLIISTLHTTGAVNTIDRIIDIFPPDQQHQIRIQLSMILRSVISQQLIQTVNGTVVPAFEIMHANNAIKNLIRESKVHQIDSVIGVSASEGMVSMDQSILGLYEKGLITAETALTHAHIPDALARRLK